MIRTPPVRQASAPSVSKIASSVTSHDANPPSPSVRRIGSDRTSERAKTYTPARIASGLRSVTGKIMSHEAVASAYPCGRAADKDSRAEGELSRRVNACQSSFSLFAFACRAATVHPARLTHPPSVADHLITAEAPFPRREVVQDVGTVLCGRATSMDGWLGGQAVNGVPNVPVNHIRCGGNLRRTHGFLRRTGKSSDCPERINSTSGAKYGTKSGGALLTARTDRILKGLAPN